MGRRKAGAPTSMRGSPIALSPISGRAYPGNHKLDDAIDFLFEWPEDKRDVLYEAALNTCFMAHDGLKPVKTARDAIRAFGAKKASLRRNLRSSPG